MAALSRKGPRHDFHWPRESKLHYPLLDFPLEEGEAGDCWLRPVASLLVSVENCLLTSCQRYSAEN